MAELCALHPLSSHGKSLRTIPWISDVGKYFTYVSYISSCFYIQFNFLSPFGRDLLSAFIQI